MQQIAIPTDPALAAFLQSVDVMPRTREAYASSIKLFLQYAQQQPLTPALVRSWKEHLLERGVGDLSVSSYLSALRSWMAWGVSHGLIAGNVASRIKQARKVPSRGGAHTGNRCGAPRKASPFSRQALP